MLPGYDFLSYTRNQKKITELVPSECLHRGILTTECSSNRREVFFFWMQFLVPMKVYSRDFGKTQPHPFFVPAKG